MQACRWCGEPTAQLLAPIDSEREPIPLHAMCGAELIDAYNRLLSGQVVPIDQRERLALLAGTD
jgi:hypothetical protein